MLSGAQDVPVNPQIVALKAIFPDYDDAVLHSVLESVDGNQDRAVDLLLGMSDPTFKSEAPPPQVQQQPQATQEELDEQLARRLMLEEQQEAQQQWQIQQQREQQRQQRPQRRTSRPQQGGGEQQAATPPMGGKDTMTEFQEQFTKIAETGKKTFGAFVSKAKAKIQELNKPGQGASGSGVQPTWGSPNSSSYYDPNAAQGPPMQANYQPYHGHQPQTVGSHSPPMNTAISQPASFYDPNPVLSPQPMPPTQHGPPDLSEPRQTSITLTGYDVTPVSSSDTNAAPASGSAPTSPPKQSGTASATSGSGFAASVPQRGPSPANPIDGGKLGLLPKRPISLVRDPPQAKSQQVERRNLDDDDDDLEYAENPFDEPKK